MVARAAGDDRSRTGGEPVSYFAAMLARAGGQWTASEVDLDAFEDIEGVADLMRDQAQGEEPVLLFVEADDEWFAVIRVDGTEEARAFLSDLRAVETNDIATLLFADELPEEAEDEGASESSDAGDDEQSSRPAPVPSGATDLLMDLGTPAGDLLKLCESEGLLPGDVVTVLAERAGAGDALEQLR
jgi:putative tRNA adenosine deaminase-associated protein